MSKQGIIGRVTQLARADISAVLDSAEDPGLLLDQLLRDYTGSISEAEQAIAQLAGNLRLMEDDQEQDARAAASWSREAEATSDKADKLRAAGDAVEADTFDSLARAALERQLICENDVRASQRTIDAQAESVETLACGLGKMTARLSELQHKHDDIAARSRGRNAPSQLPEAAVSADILDPASELPRFEEKVRREEARIDSHEVLEASALDAQFDGLADRRNQGATDERLAELKAQRAMASARARARQQVSR